MPRLSHRVLCAALAAACVAPAQLIAQRASRAPAPKLVVFITVDQLRTDYFDRWSKQMDGGLARLRKDGAFFSNGFQDHAITETAPGHASTMSGRFPVHTGIIMNSAGVGDVNSQLIGVNGLSASPWRFKGTTLTDWMKKKDSRTRVLSVSRKDRGAILPIGRSKEEVYWWASNGSFTTSTYYRDTLPNWVQRFNGRLPVTEYLGKSWTLLLADSEYPELDAVTTESGGQNIVFPHGVPSDPIAAARSMAAFPFMDRITADFALEGVNALKLGDGPQTDLLAVSFSTTDAIGHAYGPDSRELHDQVLRLDKTIGFFLDSLFKMRDPATVIVALTADHGVTPLPGTKSSDKNEKGVMVDLGPTFQNAFQRLQARGLDTLAMEFEEGVIHVNRDLFRKAKLNADSAVTALQKELSAIPGVMRVDRVRQLASRDTTKDAIARRWLHMLTPGEDHAELVVTLTPYSYPSGVGYATHGTPHDLDAHVPIIFYGPQFKAGTYKEFARVVDMAPTLAAVVGVKPMEKLDGRVLTSALK
jgi:predicted AlkP superfamily pyrophosphatase or phosphodiesterase